jgi:hypothetical protein
MTVAMTDNPWRQRIELGLRVTDELGSHWVALDGEDFLERIELAGSLTLELAESWAVVYCYCARTGRPVSIAEVSVVLEIDADEVERCLVRLEEERLVEATVQPGTYVYAPRRTPGGDQRQESSLGR